MTPRSLSPTKSPAGARTYGAATARAAPDSNIAAPALAPAPIKVRRFQPSASNIQATFEVRVHIGLSEQAGIARQRMFERSKRQPRARGIVDAAAVAQRMKHAGGEGIARADPVDDARQGDLGRLRMRVARVDPRRQ